MIELRGMTWDHPRGIKPLLAITEKYEKENPNVRIKWDARSLEDFEDYPIEVLAEKYDFIMIDHPHIGQGAENKVLEPLDNWIQKEFLDDQKNNSVGPSYNTYEWAGHVWALAADAAAQVSAYRKDLFNEYKLSIPQSWDDVFTLATQLPANLKIGLPLNPTHSYSSFITICANMSNSEFWDDVLGIDEQIGQQSIELLNKLVPIVHDKSISMNPINMLDLMSSSNEIIYSPLIFGYINYSLENFKEHIVHFTNMPSSTDKPEGSVIGGVGLSVSAHSLHKQQAMNFVEYVVSEECQRTIYFNSGGQPGHRSAWGDPAVNSKSHGFFENTLNTLDNGFVRPRFNGYPSFQEQAGEIIHNALTNKTDPSEVVRAFNDLYRKVRVGI
jgi:multiple sugar transport system substrate-binding protein